MSLNLGITNGEGKYNPYIKWNAKDGTMKVREGGVDVPVKKCVGMLDFLRIKTGQFDYTSAPPKKVFDFSIDKPQNDMGVNFKRGFVILLHSPNVLGGTFEFSSTAKSVLKVINQMYNTWEEGERGQKTKENPIVELKGSDSISTNHGTVYVPNFEVIDHQAPDPELLKIEIDQPNEDAVATPIVTNTSEEGQQTEQVKPLPNPDAQNPTNKGTYF